MTLHQCSTDDVEHRWLAIALLHCRNWDILCQRKETSTEPHFWCMTSSVFCGSVFSNWKKTLGIDGITHGWASSLHCFSHCVLPSVFLKHSLCSVLPFLFTFLVFLFTPAHTFPDRDPPPFCHPSLNILPSFIPSCRMTRMDEPTRGERDGGWRRHFHVSWTHSSAHEQLSVWSTPTLQGRA